MSKLEEERWSNDDDDNWDDWGDAEENIPEIEEPTNIAPKTVTTTKHNNNTIENSNNNEIKDSNDNSKQHQKTPESIPHENIINTSWGSVWKPWGGVVSSVFSTATEGLGNITSSVSQGLSNVMGVPEPEEMARINASEATAASSNKNKLDDDELKIESTKVNESESKIEVQPDQHSAPVFGLGLVSGVTTLGSKVLNTGLDTLEGIGKKTMNILQDNDPHLMNKRKMLGLDTEKPNLSEVLKEAKMESDQFEKTLKELKLEKSKELLRFEILFENNCGLVHLEALEILSKESTIKLQSLLNSVSGNALTELQETLNEVKELLELEDLEGDSDGEYDANELNDKLVAAIEDAELQINFGDIKKIWLEASDWLKDSSVEADTQEKFAKGITTLAETCALEINKLHKIAELLLVKEHHSTANEVDSIVQLCKHFSIHLNGLTNRFASTLNRQQSEEAKSKVNTLFGELCLAVKEIEKAYKLFLPILQIGAV